MNYSVRHSFGNSKTTVENLTFDEAIEEINRYDFSESEPGACSDMFLDGKFIEGRSNAANDDITPL